MATYVVGDIQGCFQTFLKLLEQIEYDKNTRIILLGDVINRGPRSLELLRFIINNQDNIKIILGNHEIFAIGLFLGVTQTQRKHTLDELFTAPDAVEIMNWLKSQELIIKYKNNICVHAGVMPDMSLDYALGRARLIHDELANNTHEFLKNYFNKRVFDRNLCVTQEENLYFELASFTLLRMCVSQSIFDNNYSGIIASAPAGLKPWFELRHDENYRVYFGHWAALGFYQRKNYYCLDSGCGWGRSLTALCLEDHQVFQVDNYDINNK